MKNSDSYVVITNKSFNTFTMCENTEQRLMLGNMPVQRPLADVKNAAGAGKRKGNTLTISIPQKRRNRTHDGQKGSEND